MQLSEKTIEELKAYLATREDVSLAYLFGSQAKGTATNESDVDIGVYFKPAGRALEYETTFDYPAEEVILRDVERIVQGEVDFVVLNKVPTTLFFAVLDEGKPLLVRDQSLWWRLYLTISDAAEFFRSYIHSFALISARSRSLSDVDRARLAQLVDYLAKELEDWPTFQSVSQRGYTEDRSVKRNLERWAEMLSITSIDMAKILVASEKLAMPKTYKDVVGKLAFVKSFDEKMAASLEEFAQMRNLLAHEYLDIRFQQLRKFIDKGEPAYRYLLHFVRARLTDQSDG